MPERSKVKITNIRPAGPDHRVLTLEGGSPDYMRKPCKSCPWRKDAVGEFPAEAFKHSAITAHDMSRHTFACHSALKTAPKMCAGFLLQNSDDNLSVRLWRMRGMKFTDVSDGGNELFDSYRDMAVANGVDPDDPALALCRP